MLLYSSRPNRRFPPSAANPRQATPNDRPSSCPASPSPPELRRRPLAPNQKQRPARSPSPLLSLYPKPRTPADEGRRQALPLPPSGSPSADAIPDATRCIAVFDVQKHREIFAKSFPRFLPATYYRENGLFVRPAFSLLAFSNLRYNTLYNQPHHHPPAYRPRRCRYSHQYQDDRAQSFEFFF